MSSTIPRAVVSGSASGIGQALSRGLLAAGYAVTGVDRSGQKWEADGYRHVQLDVTDTQAVAAFGSGLTELSVLVNAAGVIRRKDEFDPEVFSQVVDVNLVGAMRLSVACKSALAASGGAVVNVASMLTFFGGALVPAYSASKGGIASLTRSLAVAWAGDGLRVNAIAPGWIDTPLTEALVANEARSRQILERTPMNRWGRPDDLVGPVLFLAGEAARFVTGTILPVDGGYAAC